MKYKVDWMNLIVWTNMFILGGAFWYGVYKLAVYLFGGN